MESTTPHFLRFARALALLSGTVAIAACSSSPTAAETAGDAIADGADSNTPYDGACCGALASDSTPFPGDTADASSADSSDSGADSGDADTRPPPGGPLDPPELPSERLV